MDAPADRYRALLDAGLALASELSLDAVLQRIVELAVEVSGARYGALGILGPDGGIIEFVTTGVTEEERAAIGHTPVGRGILGVLIRDARTLRLPEISDDPRSVGFPPNHPPMHSFLGGPVKARGKVFGNLYLTEKIGAREFTDEDERALEVLAAQAGVAVENARLYEEARQRERRLKAMREVTDAVLEGTRVEDVLRLVARLARELVGATVSTIAIPADEPRTLVLAAVEGAGAERLLGATFTVEGSISGGVLEKGEPILVEDMSADPRAAQPVVREGIVGPAMFVPISVRGQAFGTLLVGNDPAGRTFTDDEVALVGGFAAQAALALEYARTQDELHRLAVLEDRERIAKELHDGVIQSLFAVGMSLQGTAALSRDPEAERRIEGAIEELDRVIRDLRNYIFGLRPGILADRQLDQALRDLVADFQERSGVIAVAEVDPTVAAELSPRAADVVQIVREALSNVGRHAEAATCRVSLLRDDGAAKLEIDDDGRGFDIERVEGGGQGLGNLRRRAEGLGGSLDIVSAAREGTTVRIRIPL